MRVSENIVCAVGGSEGDRDVVAVAGQLADALDLNLVLLHAVDAKPPIPVVAGPYHYNRPPAREHSLEVEGALEVGRRLLDGLVRDFSFSRPVEQCVELGEPSHLVPEVAERKGAALIVVGTRGRGRLKTALLGSVSAAAISRSSSPVLVVPEGGQLQPGRPVICAVDNSPAARSATRIALWLSVRLGGELIVAHAISRTPPPSASAAPGVPDRLDDLDRREAGRFLMRLALEEGIGAEVERRLTYGSEAESISQLAEEEDASLVVVGTRRRGSLRSALVGSVSHDLRSNSLRPVLVVPVGARFPSRARPDHHVPS
jgi:nucleotide-binding universal stress UspA family protein